MKKRYALILPVLALSILSYAHTGDFNRAVIERIKITAEDVPSGFVMGKIPTFAASIFKDNPCYLDGKGIKTIAKHLYPSGNYHAINSIHSTIMAKSGTPFGDDIVCYIIIYNNAKTAQKELKKLSDYVEFNNQRAVLTSRDNLAVFIHSDDKVNMSAVMQLKRTIDERLERTAAQ